MINDEEVDELSVVDDPKFWNDSTREIWKENFEKIGHITITIGDEPNGYCSRVYKDNHREFIGLNDKYELEVKGQGSDFDWEKALYANG